MDFVKLLPNKDYIIYCDSYYGSLELAENLDKEGYKFVLSVRANRLTWLFKDNLQVGLKKGEWEYKTNNNLCATSFYDMKKCNFISNCYSGSPVSSSPQMVAKYNKFKGLLDMADAHWNRYLQRQKKIKWTKVISV